MVVNPSDPAAPRSRRSRTTVKPTDRKSARADGKVKATLLLTESVDFRLTTIAASLRCDRSTLATQMIDAGLRRYTLDAALRHHAGGEAGPDAAASDEAMT